MAGQSPMAFIDRDGDRLRYNFHPGQERAWDSDRRFVLVLAGTQAGKTCFGPPWLYEEIKRRGPGDYLVVTPTYPLLELKALPEFKRLFETLLRVGRYVGSPSKKFVFSPDGCRRMFGSHDPDTPTVVHFGYAAEPDSLESATVKAAWLDEAGQKKFRLSSWEAVQRRLAIHQGRALITTTPYDMGWLKKKLHDPWQDARGNHPDIDVVRFDSAENPAFPKEEFERMRRELPRWKFDLFCRAIFTRPAGLVYDCFDEGRECVPRFAIPDNWPRFLGLDFGGANTAAVFFAEEPGTGRRYLYREYRAGSRTAKQHVEALLAGEPGLPTAVGGSHSEGQWREEFAAAGLPVMEPPVKAVDVGIDRVYAAHVGDKVRVFKDLDGYLDQKASYSYATNDQGEPLGTGEIEDKHSYHLLDAERYVMTWLELVGRCAGEKPTAGPRQKIPAEVFGRMDRPANRAQTRGGIKGPRIPPEVFG